MEDDGPNLVVGGVITACGTQEVKPFGILTPLICRKKLKWGWSGEQGLVEGVTGVDVAQSGSPEASSDWHIDFPLLLSL